jgi:hypothetical protein
MLGYVPPYLKYLCIEGHNESFSVLIPEESKGQDNVTITAKEVGKQELPEFMKFDSSTGIFNILVTKDTKPGKHKIELKASDAFGGSTSHSFYVELVPRNT